MLEAIRDKFAAARPGGWLQDSADNYEFLSFGSGVAAVEALARRGPLKSPKVGLGSEKPE